MIDIKWCGRLDALAIDRPSKRNEKGETFNFLSDLLPAMPVKLASNEREQGISDSEQFVPTEAPFSGHFLIKIMFLFCPLVREEVVFPLRSRSSGEDVCPLVTNPFLPPGMNGSCQKGPYPMFSALSLSNHFLFRFFFYRILPKGLLLRVRV